jgi:serine/threonine-protein kinase
MTSCLSCSSQIPETSRFCLSCGAPVGSPANVSGSEDAETQLRTPGRTPDRAAAGRGAQTPAANPRSTNVSRALSASSVDHGRFTPGEIVADRYRIIEQIGKGGMGEVYRADDLKLAQAVALKFLPPSFDQDASRLDRFLGEVRIARQISHANVCRVYDIGEVEGHHFLSMEYVDGEDLASLLKRIGRFPSEKATEIARQICAGLAAAHDKGILHRDLKPANVMLDKQGKVRITDFGLAGLAEDIRGLEIRAGTPAYMAPEQLAGKEVSVRSDIYALGLVLYELYTGKAAFKADTIADLRRMQTETTPAGVTSIVQECDPAVERVILRCLDRDPAMRPGSALAVAAALPGGDPLAAALAAGETPSPEMVAAAGEAGALRSKVAWACLALFLASLAGYVLLMRRDELIHMVPFEKPPEVLVDRAREILGKVGYGDAPADSARFLGTDGRYIDFIAEKDKSPDRWKALARGQPSAIGLIYRQSPRRMKPLNSVGLVQLNDPPEIISGMSTVQVDTRGRLVYLNVVPPQKDESPGPWPDPDWRALFTEAGFDIGKLTTATSTWNPPGFADAKAAWTGAYADSPEIPIRVEAAAYHGRPVYFEIVHPWSRPLRMEAEKKAAGIQIGSFLSVLFLIVALVTAVTIARRNMRLGRGDRKGSFRFALFLLVGILLEWLFKADHTASLSEEFGIFLTALGEATIAGTIGWLLYMALEPLIRRHWPDSIISWSRLLNGRFNDPMVGRDILLGAAFGTAMNFAAGLVRVAPGWFGWITPKPSLAALDALLGPSHLISNLLGLVLSATFSAMLLLFFFTTGLISSRSDWRTSTIIFYVICAFFQYLFSQTGIIAADVVLALTVSAAVTFVLVRLGLFALIVTLFFLTWNVPVPGDPSDWYTGTSVFALMLLMALVLHGFHHALAGQPLFGGKLAED